MHFLVAIFLLFTAPLHAEEIVLGMDNDTIAITTNFDGSSILIFGAVKRQTPIPDDPLEVIVTVAGPNEQLEVRRMARQFGIWANSDKIQVDAAPSFYAVATSNNWDAVLTETEDLRHKISIPKACLPWPTNCVSASKSWLKWNAPTPANPWRALWPK